MWSVCKGLSGFGAEVAKERTYIHDFRQSSEPQSDRQIICRGSVNVSDAQSDKMQDAG